MNRIAALSLSCVVASAVPAYSQPSARRVSDDYELGRREFAATHYREAYVAFAAGYELGHRALFLFNMAECERLLGDTAVARVLYQRYIDDDPSGDRVATARERLSGATPPTLASMVEPAAKPEPPDVSLASPWPPPHAPAPNLAATAPATTETLAVIAKHPAEVAPSVAPHDHRKAIAIGVSASILTLVAGGVALYFETRGSTSCPGCIDLRSR